VSLLSWLPFPPRLISSIPQSNSWAVTKTRQTLLCMILFTIPNIAGTITLITFAPTPSTRGGLIVAFYFMQFFQAVRSLLALNIWEG
jgi:hypothetical protein